MSQTRMTAAEFRALTSGKPSSRPKKPNAKKRARRTKAQYAAIFAATPPAPRLTETERQRQRALFERHDRVEVSIRLPLPPSTNHHWITTVPPAWKRPLVSIGPEGQAFIDAVAAAWLRHWNGWPPEPLTGRIRLLLRFSMRDRREADISNRIKSLEDALTKCGAWLDDSQIDDGRQLRGPVCPPTGYVDVIIETMGE